MNLIPIDSVTTLPQLWDNTYKHSVPEDVVLTAYNGGAHSLTYKEVNARAHCLAAYLLSKGLQHNDRVIILSENQPVFLCWDLAVMLAAGTSVVLSKRFKPQQVAAVIEATEPKFVLVSEYESYHALAPILNQFADKLEIICANDNYDEPQEGDRFTTLQSAVDIGKVFWRENTTLIKETKESVLPQNAATILYDPHPHRKAGEGNPSFLRLTGVVLSHGNIIASIKLLAHCAQTFNRKNRILSFLTPTSAYQRIAGYYLPVALGMPLLLANNMAIVPTLLRTQKPTVLIGAPAFLRFLFGYIRSDFRARHWLRARWFDRAVRIATHIRELNLHNKTVPLALKLQHNFFGSFIFKVIRKDQLNSLSLLFSTGKQLTPLLEYFFELVKLPITTGFGLNETSGLITLNPIKARLLGSVGRVIEQGRIKIQRGAVEHVVLPTDAPAQTPLGIIYVGGSTLMMGTWQQQSRLVPAQEWYETGHTGYFENGYLFLQQK